VARERVRARLPHGPWMGAALPEYGSHFLETYLRFAGSLIGRALLEVRHGVCLAVPSYRLQHGAQLRFSFQRALAVSL
jgi:hypothetical protein